MSNIQHNPQQARISIPPFRYFEVTIGGKPACSVVAHVLQYTENGQAVLFYDYRYATRYNEAREPVETVVMELQRFISGGDIDVREVNVAVGMTSSLLSH